MVVQSPDTQVLQWVRRSTGPISMSRLTEEIDRDRETIEQSCHRLRESRFVNQHLPEDAWTITKKGIDWLDRNTDEVPVASYQCTECRRRPEFQIETEATEPPRFCPWCSEHTLEQTGVDFQ